jgi:putative transcriptional regulator
MNTLHRALGILALLFCAAAHPTFAQEAARGASLMLMANPALADPVFGQTVLLTAPLKEGARIGVILNRPTEHPMQTLFPDHKVLGKIKEHVYYGGPMLPEVMVMLMRSETDPGQGALKVGSGLFLALSAPLIEKTLREQPASARCFVGSVLWQDGELDEQIKEGVWSVVQADNDSVFSRNPENLWESLQHKTHQLTAALSIDARP